MSQSVPADFRTDYFPNALQSVAFRLIRRFKSFSNWYHSVPLFKSCQQFGVPRWRYFSTDYVANKMQNQWRWYNNTMISYSCHNFYSKRRFRDQTLSSPSCKEPTLLAQSRELFHISADSSIDWAQKSRFWPKDEDRSQSFKCGLKQDDGQCPRILPQ
jgi:hypothetical protein